MFNIIINADDFGKSREINDAIMHTMDMNLCKDTTLLVNFETSSDAAKLAISRNKENNVGIHLNLTEGSPLTNNIKKEKRFCDNNGFFHYKKDKRIIFLSPTEKRAVYEELTSQINFCRSLGIPISHADSHNHIHEELGMLEILIIILKKENIPFLRITRNIGKASLLNNLYRNAYNSILSCKNLTGSNYFGSTFDYNYSKKLIKQNSIIELMIHPGLITNNQVFDNYSKENLSTTLTAILNKNNLTSYQQIKQ